MAPGRTPSATRMQQGRIVGMNDAEGDVPVVLAIYADRWAGEVTVARLRAQGIDASITPQPLRELRPAGEFRVFVHRADLERAAPFVDRDADGMGIGLTPPSSRLGRRLWRLLGGDAS